ncbi:hypothetical protein MMC24_001165 [Lignoscripta atroalba]|nr:hypothetical protein [Lignoscripta atroalba]
MARKSKFSFPLPSHRPSAPNDSTVKGEAWGQGTIALEPVFSPGGKLERLLGAPDTNHNGSTIPTSPDSLQSKNSFVTVTVSDMSCEGVDGSHEVARQLRTKGSSSVLRTPSNISGAKYDSMTDVLGPALQSSGSSSTLRSYYNPKKSPPCVSQQTSASSARDMALRKGCPPIPSPLSHDAVSDKMDSASEDEDDNINQYTGKSRQRPPRLDLSMLFPKPRASSGPLLSPNRITTSPSVLSLVSDGYFATSPVRRNWLGWRSSKLKMTSIGTLDTAPGRSMIQQPAQISREHHLKSRNADIENWRVDSDVEDSESHEGLHPSELDVYDIPPRNGRSISHSASSTTSLLSPRLMPANATHPYQSMQLWEAGSTFSTRSRKSERSACTSATLLSCSDLHQQSVLALSSSEDESGEEDLPHVRKARRRRIRDDVDDANGGDDVVVFHTGPGKVARMRSQQVTPTPECLKLLQVSEDPGVHAQQPSKRKQKKRESKEWENTPSTGITFRKSSVPVKAETMTVPYSHSQGPRHSGARRVMAVTQDEERLLGAMREKRASMRRIGDAGGYNMATRQGSDGTLSRRPKTAEVTKRASWFFEADMSDFPRPPSSESSKVFRHVRPPFSTEYLPTEISSAAVECTPVPKRTSSLLYASKVPPSLSLDPSDMVPSPATSGASPLTPPLGRTSVEIHEDGGVGLPDSTSSPLYQKHLRKRTVSSGMIIFEGDVTKALDHDGEEANTQLAMDRYM